MCLFLRTLALLPKGIGKYTANDHEIKFINGSVIRFRHCFSTRDVFRYQGAEINYLYIDELTHFPKEMYDYLKTRLRAEVALGITPQNTVYVQPWWHRTCSGEKALC